MRGKIAKRLRREADDLQVRGTPHHRKVYKQLKKEFYNDRQKTTSKQR
jgi:hypothetical protein